MKTLASMVGIGVISMTVALSPVFAQQTKPMDQPSGTATVQPKTDTNMPAPGTSGKDDKTLPAKPGATVKNEGTPAKTPPEVKGGMATVQPKTDAKAPTVSPSGKDDKTLPAKPGPAVKNESIPAKPAPDVKSGSATVQPKTDAKAPTVSPSGKDDKTLPAKPGSAVKNESIPTKPATDVKSGSATVQPKTEAKAPEVKSGSVSGKSETGAKDEKSAPVKPGATLKNDKPAKTVPQVKAEGKSKHLVTKTSHKKASSKKHAKTVTTPRDTDKKVEQGNTVGVPSGK